MALDAHERQSRAGWTSRDEVRLAPGAGLLVALALSLVLWMILISVGMKLVQFLGLL